MKTPRIVRHIVSLAASVLLVGLMTGNAQANSVSGEAFGVSAQALVTGAGVRVGPTPHVVLCPDGGMAADQLLKISLPNLVASDTLAVVTTGSIGPNAASAQSSATVEQVNLLNRLVTARLVVAISSSPADGSTATSTADRSTLIGLSINRSQPVDVTPAPNTTVAVPRGTVTLNEQIAGRDGGHTPALTVNKIHVVLRDPVTGIMLTVRAVVCTPSPPAKIGRAHV